jgi:hypothetical protein
MPIKTYWSQLEPPRDAMLWRFMDLRKFRDLMSSEELYFRRADLYLDKSEGLPPEDYAFRVLGLDPYDINDRAALNNHLGSLAQHREAFYISCWYLYAQGLETLDMWETYGHDGVAVCSRYDLLYSALDGLLEDDAHLGRVQYGTKHLTDRFNGLEFITAKQLRYAPDCEARAFITAYDPLATGNRHIDLNNSPHPQPLPVNPRNSWVPDSKRRRINLRNLITDVVISPWAEAGAVEEINLWVKLKGFPASASRSELTSASTPTLAEFRKHRHLFSKRPAEDKADDKTEATLGELAQCDIPLLSDAQYLEATLRLLDMWKKQKI